MRTVGVISDTHASEASDVPAPAIEALEGVDRILHAGDVVAREVLECLRGLAPVDAVRGNMDRGDTAGLPTDLVVEVEEVAIGVTHGTGGPRGIEERVVDRFDPGTVRVVCHGHSHVARVSTVRGVLVVNPGSPVSPRRGPPSVGRIQVDGDEVAAEIVTL